MSADSQNSLRPGALAGLTLGAIGVVYGDIGTSPLYALKEVFAHGRVPLTPENILGILSLVFWTLTVVVTLKYVTLILRADNNGEGGLIAMLALASQAVKDRPVLRSRLLLLGIFGTAIFFGDGVITPAVSVLGAVEGLEVAAPGLHRFVVPVSLVVLTLLFFAQRFGTAVVGRMSAQLRWCGLRCWRCWAFRTSCETQACWWRCCPRMRWASCWRTRTLPSLRWVRWCCASPGPKRCTPTWATLASDPFAWPGLWW